jgi:hypothetical protein
MLCLKLPGCFENRMQEWLILHEHEIAALQEQ